MHNSRTDLRVQAADTAPEAPADDLTLRFRKLSRQDARCIAWWRYSGPYAFYNLDQNAVTKLLEPEFNYHAILDGEDLIGFYCMGEDARVHGWNYDESAIDFGMGLRPDLTGRGFGKVALKRVLDGVKQTELCKPVRATIAVWNERAISMSRQAGFQEIGRFMAQGAKAVEFLVLVRS